MYILTFTHSDDDANHAIDTVDNCVNKFLATLDSKSCTVEFLPPQQADTLSAEQVVWTRYTITVIVRDKPQEAQ